MYTTWCSIIWPWMFLQDWKCVAFNVFNFENVRIQRDCFFCGKTHLLKDHSTSINIGEITITVSRRQRALGLGHLKKSLNCWVLKAAQRVIIYGRTVIRGHCRLLEDGFALTHTPVFC